MAQCTTTALAGAMPRPCVRGARGRFRGLRPVPGVVSLPFPPSRPACPALRVAGRPVCVSLTLARWYAIPHGLCVPRARSGCPSGSPRVPFACVCARAPAASAPAPPLGCVVCALRAVPALGAGRAVPRGPCPSACPAPVPCSAGVPWGGGRSGPGSPLPGLGLCAPLGAGPWRSCAGARVGGGGGRAPCPPFVRPGGPVGQGVALPRSVPLPPLGRQQIGCHWRRSGHRGRGPHTAQVRVRPPSLGAIYAAFWRIGADSLVPRGSCGTRQQGRGGGLCSCSSLGRGEGGPSPLPRGGGGWCPRGLRANGGGFGGGGVPPRPPCSPSGGRPAVPYPGPPVVVGAIPSSGRVRSGSRGRPGGGGTRGGPWTAPLGAPSDLNRPSALPEWAMVMGGVTGGAAPYCSGAPPCATPRLGPRATPARWCGLARQP